MSSLEEQVAQLNQHIAELIAAGHAATQQLRDYGDHQISGAYGHFSERCYTCQVADHFDKVAAECLPSRASQPPA